MAKAYETISYPEIQNEAQRLIAGDTATVEGWFTETGISRPLVIWDPARSDLVTDPVRFVYDYWHDRKPATALGMPSAAVDPSDLIPALGYIILLDILEDGRDYRYRLFGSKIAEIAKFDSTGLRISETKAHPLMKAFFATVYEAVLRCGRPVYTEHNPPPNLTIATWHRIVLPLVDEVGRPDRFLVGNVPAAYHEPDVRETTLFNHGRR